MTEISKATPADTTETVLAKFYKQAPMAEEVCRVGSIVYFSQPFCINHEPIWYRHTIINENTGEWLPIAFSENFEMSQMDLQRWVDLGCPEDAPGEKPAIWTPSSLIFASMEMSDRQRAADHKRPSPHILILFALAMILAGGILVFL